MVFNENAPALSELCQQILDVVDENTPLELHPSACILTYLSGPSDEDIRSFPYSRSGEKSEVIERIRSSKAEKPVTKKMKAKNESPMRREEGSFQDYFTQNINNPLVSDERIFLEAHGYDITQSKYFAIPFPSGLNVKGVFFLFALDEEAFLTLKGHLNAVIAGIENNLAK